MTEQELYENAANEGKGQCPHDKLRTLRNIRSWMENVIVGIIALDRIVEEYGEDG